MQGLTLQSLKKHSALIPLYACIGLGMSFAVFYSARLALRNPDVQWNRDGNISNEYYRDKQYKFYAPNTGGSPPQSQAPKY